VALAQAAPAAVSRRRRGAWAAAWNRGCGQRWRGRRRCLIKGAGGMWARCGSGKGGGGELGGGVGNATARSNGEGGCKG